MLRHAGHLMLALALLLQPLAARLAHAEPAAHAPQTVRSAEFSIDGGAHWTAVSLPDTWSLRGLEPRGRASYRLTLMLPAAPAEMWALRVDRISSANHVSINGRLVHSGSSGMSQNDGRPVADLVDLPPDALRVGANEVLIELDYRNRGGLSELAFGPLSALQAGYSRHVTLTETLPESLNIAGAAFGLFMCAIWWRRRSETAIGWFGALCVLVSVRNYCYFVVDGPPVPAGLSNWGFYMAQVTSALLFGAFALALSERRVRWFERTLKASAIVLPLCSVLAFGHAPQALRAVTYPLVIGLSLASLWLVTSHARRVRQFVLFVLPSGLAMVLFSGVHDYLYQQGHLSSLGGYWMPYATPVALFSFALVLVNRLVQALTDVEILNTSLERRVADRTHELEIANAAKSRFLAAASHDLRQPVVTIGLLVGLVREQLGAQPAMRSMLERIHDAVLSLETLLKGLLDLSRLESGTNQPRLQVVSLQRLFEDIDLHEQTAALLKGVQLRFRGGSLSVMSDPVLLDQIVRNLVSNAVRYTERGGVLVSARLRRSGHVLLQVRDTGRGIPAEAQELVFEEFVQLDNPGRDRGKGLGLGLSIVRRSVRLLGARLSLDSRAGRGSCFTLELPLARRDLPATPLAASVAQPLGDVHVWLIEDDAAVRDALQTRLQQWGARVHALTGRAELIRFLAGEPAWPAVVVSDQRLADGDGLSCIALLRARARRDLPAVIVTGDTSPTDLATLRAADVPVLFKPFSADELLSCLQAILRSTSANA